MELEKDTVISYDNDSINYINDDELNQINKHVKNGFYLALFSATMISLASLVFIFLGPNPYNPVDEFGIVQAAITFALAFGINKKNRLAISALLLMFSTSLLYNVFFAEIYSVLYLGSVFFYIYTRAALSIFKFHKLKKQ